MNEKDARKANARERPSAQGNHKVTRGQPFMVAVAALIGLGGGLGAVALRYLIEFVQRQFFGGHRDLLALLAQTPPAWLVLAPAVGGLVVGPIVYFLAREARGHGVPEVMESMIQRGGVIRPRVVVVKAVASAITIGSGGSVGREGPIVQIGSALGSTLGQLLGMPTRHIRTLVGCGAAAGIAAAFNAPIAGALFAVEILLGDFGVPQFSPIVISSVVATVVSRHFHGNYPAFDVPAYALVSPFELLPYAVLGVLCGLVALAFIASLYGLESSFERLRLPGSLQPAAGGLLVGAIGLALPQVFGVGYETIDSALAGELSASLLVVLLAAKLGATCITLASGGSGGVFAPSLFLGAVTGGFFGTFVHAWFPTATASSGAYALVAMGAVVGAATHAPITAIIMIFELTGDYRIIAPLMITCVISTTVATWLRRDSIYTLKLRLRGIDPFPAQDPNVLKGLYVRDIIDREPEVVEASTPFVSLLDLVVRSRHTQFFVVDGERHLLGAISLAALRQLIFERDALHRLVVARDLIEPERPVLTEEDDLDVTLQLFSLGDVEEIAVVDSGDRRRLIGAVHQRDVIHARNEELLRRDLAGSLSSTVSLVGKVRQVEIGEGYVVQESPAPRRFVGHTLRELDVGARYGVQVIFIRSRSTEAGRTALRVPVADGRIGDGDTLILAGPKSAVDAVAAT